MFVFRVTGYDTLSLADVSSRGRPAESPPPRTSAPRPALQLLDVLSHSSSYAFSGLKQLFLKKRFWRGGCEEVGIKWGSESTVGRSTRALSGLSVNLTPTPTICFLSRRVVEGALFL